MTWRRLAVGLFLLGAVAVQVNAAVNNGDDADQASALEAGGGNRPSSQEEIDIQTQANAERAAQRAERLRQAALAREHAKAVQAAAAENERAHAAALEQAESQRFEQRVQDADDLARQQPQDVGPNSHLAPPQTQDTASRSAKPSGDVAESLFELAQAEWAGGDFSAHFEALLSAAAEGHTEARVAVAYTQLLGNSSLTPTGADYIPRNVPAAVAALTHAADLGHPGAQFALGFLHAVGLGVNASQAKALIYYTFAALGGFLPAQMALGYRYAVGVGVQKSCETSLSFYRKAADQVVDEVEASGGVVVERVRLSDDRKRAHLNSLRDIVQYYRYTAERGDAGAQVVVGQLLYEGGHGVDPNLPEALRHFEAAARAGDGNALAFLGEMHATGRGVPHNNASAKAYYEKAADKRSPRGLNGLGTLYLHGQGVPKDNARALKYFTEAATAGHPDAQFNVGALHLNGVGVPRDYKQALHFFKLGAQNGHVLGLYNLGIMHSAGIGTIRSCEIANDLFKNVAERAQWTAMFEDALELFEDEQIEGALTMYLLLGESGVEKGQFNAAYILAGAGGGDHSGLDRVASLGFDRNGTHARALAYYRRSAHQGHVASRVSIGDYHYYGHVTPVNLAGAASEYRLAAESNNAQAAWNLGYMHERGLGLPQDLHLAKRFYDQAADMSADAQVLARLASAVVYAKLAWQHARRVLPWNGDALAQRVASVAGGDVDALLAGSEAYVLGALLGLLGVVLLARSLQRQQHADRERLQQQLALARQARAAVNVGGDQAEPAPNA